MPTFCHLIGHRPYLGIAVCLTIVAGPVCGQTPVTADTIRNLAIFPTYSAPAAVISLNKAQIGAEISATVKELPIRVGDEVETNAVLAQLDCRDYVFAVQQAQALLKAARSDADFTRYQLERAEALEKTNAVTKETLNERQAHSRKSEAEVERLSFALQAAERQVEKCTIRAPFNAVVLDRLVSEGELVAPGTPVARLLDRENLEVSGNIQDQDLHRLRTAASIRFVSADRGYPVTVRVILPFVESRLRSYTARFSFLDTPAPPGEVGRIEWVSPQRHLPSELLVRRGDAIGVFIADGGRARFHALANAHEGQPAVVELPENTPIVVEGRFQLMDGDAVSLTYP